MNDHFCLIGPRVLVDDALNQFLTDKNINRQQILRFETEIPEDLLGYSLFESPPIIFVANQGKDVIKIVENISNYPGCAIIIDYEDWQANDPTAEIAAKKRLQESRIKIYKEFNLTINQLKLPSKALLSKWIYEKAKTMKIDLAMLAANLLSQRFSDDLDALVGELGKFKALNRQVELADVRDLTIDRTNSNVFAVIDAIESKNLTKAIQGLNELLDVGQDPFQFLALIANSYQLKAQVFALWQDDKSIKADDIAKNLKIHPFRAIKALESVKKLSEESLLQQLNLILQTELDIKSGKNVRIGLEVLIAGL